MIIRDIVDRLVAQETSRAGPSALPGRAGFRVCERLRVPLAHYVGVVGFRSLLRRALMLAHVDAPGLVDLKVADDGTFLFPAGMDSASEAEVAAAGAAITRELLDLLVTFVGEALTLRLLHEVWPEAKLSPPRDRE